MSQRNGLILRWGLALGIPLLLVGLFFAFFELRMETRDTAGSREAKRDPLLALDRLLTAAGHRVERIGPDDEWFAEDFGLLVIDQDYLGSELGYGNAEAFRSWLEEGGRALIMISDASALTDEEREFLAGMGFSVEAREGNTPSGSLGTVRGSGQDQYRVQLDASVELGYRGTALSQAEADGKLCWVEGQVGLGSLLLTGDGSWWHNKRLGRHDHAGVLELVAPRGAALSIGLMAVPSEAPAAQWPPAWRALVLPALVLVVLLVWAAAPRLGPALQLQATERRSIEDRLMADAWFLWRRVGSGRLARQMLDSYERHRRRGRAVPEAPPEPIADTVDRDGFRRLVERLENARRQG